MYEKVFQFNSRPFTATPFVKHFFPGDSIHQALTQAQSCIERASGPVMAIGGAGTGKSLLLAMLEDQYQSQFNVVNLACARMEKRQDLLQSILFELKQPFQGLSDSELRFALIDYLSPSDVCENGILLLIDEAHLLSTEMLDEVRLITNFVREGQPRVRLVMAGNQRLEEHMGDPKLESFNQRIAGRCYLANMNLEETSRYIVDHIDRAGGAGDQLFEESALKAIYEVSDGCPRLINQVCDHALILAATRGELVVTDASVHEAWADVQSIPGNWAAPATQPESSSELEGEESWTVIEFGQLDDADEGEAQALEETVISFTDSTPHDEVDGDDHEQDHSMESSVVDVVESIEPIDHFESVHPQEVQTSASRYEYVGSEHSDWEPSDSSESDSGSETVDDQEMAGDHFSADSDGQQAVADSIDAPGEISNDESLDEVEEQLASMEAQLSSVFGEELGANSVEKPKKIEDLEAEQLAILDEVEQATQESGVNEFESGNVEAGAGTEGIEPVESSEDSSIEFVATHESMINQTQALQAVHQESSDQEVAGRDLEPPTESDWQNDASTDSEEEFQQNETLAEAVTSSAQDEVESESHCEDQVDAVETFEEGVVAPAADPFAEEFAEEEHLLDRFAPFVAHQNQSSLTITASEIEMIRPLDAQELGEPESNGSEDDSSQRETSQACEQEADVAETISVYDAQEEDIANEAALSPALGVHVIETNDETMDVPVAGPLLHADEPVAVRDEATAAATEVDEDTEKVSPEDERESSTLAPEEIERQAEEILKRLAKVDAVSCETDEPDVPHTNEESVQTDTGDNEFERQSAAIDETQQILNEILEQKSMIAEQQEALDGGGGSPSVEGPHVDLQVERGSTSSEIRTPQDDREMIIVNRMEEAEVQPAPEEPGQEAITFPATPISTGRAERMDYQKLFEQLRDISNSQQSQ